MATLTEKKNAKRATIIESAISLFTEKNFSTTAIDDIVKMAGVAKGTFYLYFKDKYDLLDQIVVYQSASLMNDAIGHVENNSSDDDSLTDKVLLMVNYVEDYLISRREFTALVEKKLSSSFRIIAEDKSGEYGEMKEKLLAPFIREGYSREDGWMLIYIITDMVGSICCDAILTGSPFPVTEIRSVLNNSVLKLVKKDD